MLNKFLARFFGSSSSSRNEQNVDSEFGVQVREQNRVKPHERKSRATSTSVIYQIKKDALHLATELNRGAASPPDCEKLARHALFYQKQLIHGLYNDPTVSDELKKALVNYHMMSTREDIAERRGAQRRLSANQNNGQ